MRRKFLAFLLIIVATIAVSSRSKANHGTSGVQDENLKIVSKPNPRYTREARSRNLEGTVLLRVTFLSNGKIGDVVDETKDKAEEMRESGLTANAIQAAKKIKFVPAKKDGVPIDVKRRVEYVFDLY